jgi:hypothetical protein
MEKQSFLTKEKHKSYMQRIKETDTEKYEELKKDQARRSKAYRASLTGEKKQREHELAALRWKRFAERNNDTKETNKSYWQRIKETDPEKYEELKKEKARRNKAYRASLTGEKKQREKELAVLRRKRFVERKNKTKETNKSYWQRIKETDPGKYEKLKKDQARRNKAYRASLTGEKKRREKELADLRRKRFVQRKKESKDIQLNQGVGSDTEERQIESKTAPQVRVDEEKLQGKKQIEEEVISESEREIKQQTEHVQEAECDNEDFTKTTMQRERKALADEQSQELQDEFMESVNEAVVRVKNEKQILREQNESRRKLKKERMGFQLKQDVVCDSKERQKESQKVPWVRPEGKKCETCQSMSIESRSIWYTAICSSKCSSNNGN